jgi:hypothetical protein
VQGIEDRFLENSPAPLYTLPVRIFKNTWFDRFAGKENISDAELKVAVKQIEAGQVEADLGGGVYKKRIAREGEGKSSGYRTIVFFKSGDRAFFEYGFPKSKMDNISPKELSKLKKRAKIRLIITDEQIKMALDSGSIIEIPGGTT